MPNAATAMKERYHDQGFVQVAAASYGIDRELIASLRRHSGDDDLGNRKIWTIDPKNQNTFTLSQSLIQDNAALYMDLLVGTGLHSMLEAATGRTLYMTNLMHMISDATARTLRWHRDSYRKGGTWVGPLPPPLKCAVYLTAAGPHSSVTGFIKGSHRIDPKNIYLDFIAASLITPLQAFPTVAPGDAVLFDGSIIHCRRKPKPGTGREAIIFGLTSHRAGQAPYLDGHRPVIDAFNGRISQPR